MTEDLSTLTKYIPFLIPILVVQLGLMAFALVDLRKRERTRGPKWVWALVIILGELLGPLVYFLFGRDD